jgi:alpha-L-fucosidase
MTDSDRIRWWCEARFGMFVHWGAYSVPARGEWIMLQEHVPLDEYTRYADAFQPRYFDPMEWIGIARDAGMRYIVLTARHHDGYCLFDSKASDFTSAKIGPKRDLIAEFAEACHSAGMRMGLYYSLMDWRFPGAMGPSPRLPDEAYAPMVEQAHAQVREICSNYGKVDVLWYDGMYPGDSEFWHSAELNAMARSLQPEIIINDRAGVPEDFGTPENVVVPEARPWEACYTLNRTWGINGPERCYKTPCEIIYLLARCGSDGGNLLLNVSPDADGRIPVEQLDILRVIGQWVRRHEEVVRDTERPTFDAPNLGWTTRAGGRDYILAIRWHGSELTFGWCKRKVRSARLVSTGQHAEVVQDGDRVHLRGLPVHPPDPYLNPIEIVFE